MLTTVFHLPTDVAFIEGARTLGLQIRNTTALIQQLEQGFEAVAVTCLAKRLCLPIEDFCDQLGSPSRSFNMALKNHKRISRANSQLVYRLGRIFERSLKIFHGDEKKAARWMVTPQFGLNNATPLRFARTEVGGECVLALLDELIDGGVA
jgi:putative toxin-antitoxin system antitoxin component (TIGR02293 family)